MPLNHCQNLLHRVARRQHAALCLRRWATFWLWGSGVYLVLLVLSRGLGVIPPWFTGATIAGVPAVALLLAVLGCRRTSVAEAARLVDARLATKDLFLTAATIEGSLGAYQALVLAQAEQRGAALRPAHLVQFDWRRALGVAFGTLAVLVPAVLYLPQWDPFGRQERYVQHARQQDRLRALRQATALRASLLQQKAVQVQEDPAAQAVSDLEKIFQQANPAEPKRTQARLQDQQKVLGELWRQAREEKLRNAGGATSAQSFGQRDPAKAQQWQKDLESGDPRSVTREVQAWRELAAKMAQAPEGAAREAMRQELANRMRELQEALAQSAPEWKAALQRAMEQLQMAGQQDLAKEALQGLNETLALADAELAQLARALADAKALDQALQALQCAKRLNEVKPLDGQQSQGCANLADYIALYDQLYQSACAGQGTGTGNQPGQGGMGNGQGQGQGVGPRPSGDERAQTAFQSEQSASAYQPGKILLSWKTKGLSEAGQANRNYRQAVEAARQDASEALLKEQIPSAYHTTIKSYFDSLPREAEPAPARP